MTGLRQPESFRARYGPWAVVTGASAGLGRASAQLLADAGINLVLVARRGDVLDQMAKDFADVQARPIVGDLATAEGRAALEEGTTDLDVGLLVAAAGYGTSGPFLDSDWGVEDSMLDLNCRASLWACAHFGPRLVARGQGGIVLFGSVVGLQGTPYSAHYAATKAYVHTLAEGLYVELKPRGVDVISCAPGPVRTEFADRAGLAMGQAAQPGSVMAATLNALGRQPSIAPGLLAKALTFGLAPLPRSARSQILARVMRQMSQTSPS